MSSVQRKGKNVYYCDDCGEWFDEPTIRVTRENLDGEHGWETRAEQLCPMCGSPEIEEKGQQEDDAEQD